MYGDYISLLFLKYKKKIIKQKTNMYFRLDTLYVC